ncbi:hypothetical protein M885DRAFT_542896 [Pelagophyceae sp. CCMP2097]|nr:hypothetical protein M885DRAFT_542896 [Pelagophyceae sp. CCMP2097]|mmetsp:Transcript_30435/g.104653  ORF Transcript_30435/g.104653 Transcript_30435/m.104653 type:complete len:274 (-) Transcript_30435:1494-2315(-)
MVGGFGSAGAPTVLEARHADDALARYGLVVVEVLDDEALRRSILKTVAALRVEVGNATLAGADAACYAAVALCVGMAKNGLLDVCKRKVALSNATFFKKAGRWAAAKPLLEALGFSFQAGYAQLEAPCDHGRVQAACGYARAASALLCGDVSGGGEVVFRAAPPQPPPDPPLSPASARRRLVLDQDAEYAASLLFDSDALRSEQAALRFDAEQAALLFEADQAALRHDDDMGHSQSEDLHAETLHAETPQDRRRRFAEAYEKRLRENAPPPPG